MRLSTLAVAVLSVAVLVLGYLVNERYTDHKRLMSSLKAAAVHTETGIEFLNGSNPHLSFAALDEKLQAADSEVEKIAFDLQTQNLFETRSQGDALVRYLRAMGATLQAGRNVGRQLGRSAVADAAVRDAKAKTDSVTGEDKHNERYLNQVLRRTEDALTVALAAAKDLLSAYEQYGSALRSLADARTEAGKIVESEVLISEDILVKTLAKLGTDNPTPPSN